MQTWKNLRFGDWALKLGFMTREQFEQVLAKQKISKQRIGQLCIDQGILTHEQAAQVIAAQYGYDYVQLDDVKLPDIAQQIPLDLMVRYQFIPYRQEADRLDIAMADLANFVQVTDELEMLLDLDVGVVITSGQRIRQLLKDLEVKQSSLESTSDHLGLAIVREAEKGGGDTISFETLSTEESPVIKLVNTTILDAINKRASDIHIETSDKGLIVRYRIDGMLHQATEPLDAQYQGPVISRIKVMSELDISERRIPQDGRFKLKVMDRFIDFRVSILPTVFGEDAVIRILDRETLVGNEQSFRLENMGLPQKELVRLRRMIRAPYGMFLMTGPTGSGKTTTLYRALSEVKTKDTKIITIEDPVEYQLDGIVQIPVNEKKGLTFARGLRSILRHDPDKILVGEIRDAETAQIAIQSALTGHLVFTTVHANWSFEVINRFIHMGIEPYNLMSALNCIVAQRLIRTLCSCKEVATIADELFLDSGLDPNQFRTRIFYQPKGCEQCKGTGYLGRKAIIELVELDDDLRDMLMNRTPLSAVKKKAEQMGTVFLRQAALHEIFQGITTLEEANRVTFIER